MRQCGSILQDVQLTRFLKGKAFATRQWRAFQVLLIRLYYSSRRLVLTGAAVSKEAQMENRTWIKFESGFFHSVRIIVVAGIIFQALQLVSQIKFIIFYRL